MSKSSKHPLFWLAGGALIGALLTFLFGTEKGKQSRRQFFDWLRKL